MSPDFTTDLEETVLLLFYMGLRSTDGCKHL